MIVLVAPQFASASARPTPPQLWIRSQATSVCSWSRLGANDPRWRRSLAGGSCLAVLQKFSRRHHAERLAATEAGLSDEAK
jgi:hypothetical protein